MSFIKGKILRIIDEHTVVIDVGTEQGVRLGTRFVIYANAGELTDPDTKKKLGVLEIPKGEVTCKLVQEEYSVAETGLESKATPLAQILSFSLKTTIDVHESLEVETKEIEPLPEDIFKVKVGDLVRTVESIV